MKKKRGRYETEALSFPPTRETSTKKKRGEVRV